MGFSSLCTLCLHCRRTGGQGANGGKVGGAGAPSGGKGAGASSGGGTARSAAGDAAAVALFAKASSGLSSPNSVIHYLCLDQLISCTD